MRFPFSALAYFICIPSFAPAAAQNIEDLSPSGIYEANKNSTVLIKILDGEGKQTAQGSGFLVSEDGRIFTNFHVIRHAKAASVYLSNGDAYDAVEVVDVDKRRDIALLKIRAVDQRPVRLGRSSDLKVGDKIFALTNPNGLQNSLSEGIVSAIRQADGFKLLQITAPISPGSSGGPIFDSKGNVVGIAVGTWEGQALNVAIPIDYARGMLSGTTLQPLATFYEPEPRTDDQKVSPTSPSPVPTTSTNREESRESLVVKLAAELKESSGASFLERRFRKWTRKEVEIFFGEPTSHRFFYDGNKTIVADIYAYPDPTRKNREIEVIFNKGTTKMEKIFVYPWRMSWDDCKRTWGEDVTLDRMDGGRKMYHYKNRRISVLVDKAGQVVNYSVF